MQKEIKYIGFYQNPLGSSKRTHALSAVNKMDYIATTLNESGFYVHIVTPSWMEDEIENPFFEKTKTERLLIWKTITSVFSWKTKTKIGLYFKIVLSLLWLFIFLIKNVKRNEKILVYHSPWLALPIILAKKIKKIHIILEVEEIYDKVWQIKNILSKWECKIINKSSSYLIVSELLGEYLPNNPKLIIYGNYQVVDAISKSKVQEKIRIVYAGSIDDTKGGANNIIECAKFLSTKYSVHIIGYGKEKNISLIKNKIISINNDGLGALCFYHGIKRGKEYSDFLINCDVGVNSQLNGVYMQTAFPSKILSYLSHNLCVVSTPIISVKNSRLAPYINFTCDDSPQSIAEAIKNIDVNSLNDPRIKIKELHTEFVEGLKDLINR